MANSVMMFDVLGYPRDHPDRVDRARARSTSCSSSRTTRPTASPASRRCGTRRSPAHALLEVGARDAVARAAGGLDWLKPLQVLDVDGRLGASAPGRAAGRLGVPVRQPALSRSRRHRGGRHGDGPRAGTSCSDARLSIRRSRAAANGSSACRARTAAGAPSTPTTTIYYLNNIPFADHGALLDPPTADVTARCISMLAQLGESAGELAVDRRGDRLSAPRPSRPTAAGTAAGA